MRYCERGSILVSVMWLLAALSLLLTASVHSQRDAMHLLRSQRLAVAAHVQLENEWQCLWWQWQRLPLQMGTAPRACSAPQVEVKVTPAACDEREPGACECWWVWLRYCYAEGRCDALVQRAVRQTLTSPSGRAHQRIWRGERRWQSFADSGA